MKRVLVLFLVAMMLAASASATVLPPEGIAAGYLSFTGIEAYRAVVLCESLSVCDEPEGKAIDTLYFADTFMTRDARDGWADCAYADGSKTGFVRSDYIAVDPAYYLTDAQTAVYAYGNTAAPRIALLDSGIKLPIIAEQGGWYVVSLRGASGWIPKAERDSAADVDMEKIYAWHASMPQDKLMQRVLSEYGSAYLWPLETQMAYFALLGRGSHGMPPPEEIPRERAETIAAQYLLDYGLAQTKDLASLSMGATYFADAQTGWVIVWVTEDGTVRLQVDLQRLTGSVLHAYGMDGHG